MRIPTPPMTAGHGAWVHLVHNDSRDEIARTPARSDRKKRAVPRRLLVGSSREL